MCGDLEPEDRLESNLHQRFVVNSHAALKAPSSSGEMNACLDALYKSVLRQCLDEAEQATAGNAYRVMAMQSLVLARLAGFLAGHVGLNEDPLRKLLEATMLGYQEADAAHANAHAQADGDHAHGHEHPGHAHDQAHADADPHAHAHASHAKQPSL